MRVRQEPLAEIAPHDVVVGKRWSDKRIADTVLIHLQKLLGREFVGLSSYLAADSLQNEMMALVYVQEHLRRHKR